MSSKNKFIEILLKFKNFKKSWNKQMTESKPLQKVVLYLRVCRTGKELVLVENPMRKLVCLFNEINSNF